jgi:uncharacterized SAM-binding protein YcdF (DUF218 family)
MKKSRPRSRFRAVLLVILLLPLLISGYTAGSIYAYGNQSSRRSAQAAIVLGAAVWHKEPSPVFRERINHAITLYRAGRVKKILLTGGVGRNSTLSEAEVAKTYAIKQGVPAADILTETRSRTTLENLRFASPIARQHGLTTFLLVTDPLHMKRAVILANDQGLSVAPSPTPTTRFKTARSQVKFLAHETCFYLDYRLRHLW